MVGTKVAITSDRPNTTRHRILGVLHDSEADAQVVFVDTPGIHRPKTTLGSRLNETATSALSDVDLILVIVDATGAVGPGDRTVLERSVRELQRATTSVSLRGDDPDESGRATWPVRGGEQDRSGPAASGGRAPGRGEGGGGPLGGLPDVEYFPVSARTGTGVTELTDFVVDRLGEGPPFFPDDVVTDTPEALWVAELVREQLGQDARRAAPRHRLPGDRMGGAPHPRRNHRRARLAKGHRHREGRRGLKAVGIAVRESAARGDLSRPARHGGEALAEPRRDARPPRLLRTWTLGLGRALLGGHRGPGRPI